jgi:tetratricopeptide (TPR) repeat protein
VLNSPELLPFSLTTLLKGDLIRPLEGPERAFLFKHALVQETVYSTLLRNETKLLHTLVAVTLEKQNPTRLDEYAAEIAHHYAEAEEDAKTLEFSTRAGDAAQRVFANAEALTQYTRAIEIARRGLASNVQLVHLFKQRGRILEITGKYFEALASYHELHKIAQASNDQALELAYLMLCAPLHSAPMDTFDPEFAKQLLLDALGTARALGDEAAEAQVLWNLTLLSVHMLRPQDGVMYGELSFELAQKLGLEHQRALTLHDLYIPYRAVGKLQRARQVQDESRALFRAMNDLAMLSDSLGMSAQFALLEGKPLQTIEYASEGMAISQAIENTFGVFFNKSFLAFAYLELGRFREAFTAVDDAIQRVRTGKVPINMLVMTGILAGFYASIGARAQSTEMAKLIRDTPFDGVPPMFRATLFALLARTKILEGDSESAETDITSGAASWDVNDMVQPAAIYMPYALAELALWWGDGKAALETLQHQAELAAANEYNLILIENRYLAGRAYMCLGDTANAILALEEARIRGEAMDAKRVLWLVLAALCKVESEQGNWAKAEEYRAQALRVLEFVIEYTPDELKPAFLKLPSVQFVLSTDTAKVP